jgi:hypothetical protein
MGVITHKEWDGIFYYERIGNVEASQSMELKFG